MTLEFRLFWYNANFQNYLFLLLFQMKFDIFPRTKDNSLDKKKLYLIRNRKLAKLVNYFFLFDEIID